MDPGPWLEVLFTCTTVQIKNKNQGKIGTRGVHTTEIKLCDDWGVMAMWGRKSVPLGRFDLL